MTFQRVVHAGVGFALASVVVLGSAQRSSRSLHADVLGDGVPEAAGTGQSGSRLKARYLVGEDGSRQPLGWFDSAREEPCAFALAADGAQRCLPSGADAGRYFGDNGCTQPLASVRKGCAAPAYAVLVTPSCSRQPTVRVFHAGGALSSPLVYEAAGSACAALTAADLAADDFYAVGDEVPPSAFVSGAEQSEP